MVEVRAVNRKQLEINLRLPPVLNALEGKVRDSVSREVARGRIEGFVNLESATPIPTVRLNRHVAAAYAREAELLGKELSLTGSLSLDTLLRLPGVVESSDPVADLEAIWLQIEPALKAALTELNQMRGREGEHLQADLQVRIEAMRGAVQRIRAQAPEVTRRYREQLRQRIEAAGIENLPANDERLLKEVVIFADRSDIAEELARLESHFAQFGDCTQSTEPVGRKLDFLAQELNREVNTIGSKANDALISTEVVVLKTELERFREQAQNVE